MITGEVEAVDRKQKIRDRYKGVDISELEVIPAKIIEDLETSSVIRRVAAYIRVSTDNDEQTSSYELQKNYYTDYIQAQPGWVFVGIYADEGISGTSLEHRKGMQQLIEDWHRITKLTCGIQDCCRRAGRLSRRMNWMNRCYRPCRNLPCRSGQSNCALKKKRMQWSELSGKDRTGNRITTISSMAASTGMGRMPPVSMPEPTPACTSKITRLPWRMPPARTSVGKANVSVA